MRTALRRWMAVAAALFLAGAAAGQESGTSGSVSGVVVDHEGKPVAGIVLMLSRAVADPERPNPGVYLATSAADGSFTLAAVVEGEYSLCASDDSGRYLNPCAWTGPVAVKLAAGESRKDVQFQVEPGVELKIDVDDPTQALASRAGVDAPANTILIGAGTPRLYLPAERGADTGNTRHFKVRIPYDRDVNLFIGSPTLALADAKGNKLNKGGAVVVVKAPRGQAAPAPVAVTATGPLAADDEPVKP